MVRFILLEGDDLFRKLKSSKGKCDLPSLDARIKLSARDDEELRAGVRTKTETDIPLSFECPRIILPDPLDYLESFLRRDDCHYSAKMSLLYTGSFDSGIHTKMKAKCAEKEKIFSLGENRGFLIMNENQPAFCIHLIGVDRRVELSFGTSGTQLRRITSYEQFETDMNRALWLLNSLANAFYTSVPDIDYSLKFI